MGFNRNARSSAYAAGLGFLAFQGTVGAEGSRGDEVEDGFFGGGRAGGAFCGEGSGRGAVSGVCGREEAGTGEGGGEGVFGVGGAGEGVGWVDGIVVFWEGRC